jgi:zinc/manganese transport system substrate-binding protein
MVLSRTGRRTGRRTTATVAIITVAIAALAGCGDDSVESDSGRTVVATTSIWGDIVSNVACDGVADVRTVFPPGVDPHTFEPSLRDREEIEHSALVVANGLDLEESLLDVLDTVAADGTPVFEMASAMETIDGDPHVWQDPTRVAAALPALGDALVAAGFDADTVERCVDEYTAELLALDADVAELVATLPEDRRVLVTNHDSLAYYADRYGFDVLGTVIPAPTTLAETNPADLEDLAALIETTGVPAIFAEEQHTAADVEALAKRVGDVDVVELHTDSLGPAGSGAETYVGLVRTNTEAIVEALSA